MSMTNTAIEALRPSIKLPSATRTSSAIKDASSQLVTVGFAADGDSDANSDQVSDLVSDDNLGHNGGESDANIAAPSGAQTDANQRVASLSLSGDEDADEEDEDEDVSSDNDESSDDSDNLSLSDIGPEDEILPTDDSETVKTKQAIRSAKEESKALKTLLDETSNHLFELKSRELDLEEVLLKSEFHPLLISQLHEIEIKHDKYTAIALAKLERSRAAAIDNCLATAKLANDTFLDRRKRIRDELSGMYTTNRFKIENERSRPTIVAPEGSIVPTLKRKDRLESTTFSSRSLTAQWLLRENAMIRRSIRGTGSLKRKAVVPMACEGLGLGDIEDDVALIKVLSSQ